MRINQEFMVIIGSLLLGFSLAGHAAAATRGLTLSRAVALALKHQPVVAAQLNKTNAASRLADAQQAVFLPQIGLQAGSLFSSIENGSPDFESSNGRREITGQVVLTQKIYDPQATAAMAAARAQAAFTHYRALQGRLAIAGMVARTYYKLQMQQAAITIWRLAVNQSQANQAATKQGLAAGIRSELDLLRSRTALRETQQSLIRARLERSTTARLLMLMTGLSSLPPQTIEPAIGMGFILPSLAQLEAAALTKQPALAMAESRKRRAAALVAVARGRHMPHVKFQAAYGWDTLALPWDNRPGWSIGVNVFMPIFHSGELRARQDAARLRLTAARERSLQARLNLRTSLNAVWGKAKAALEACKSATNLLQDKKQMWQISKTGYRVGRLSSLELLLAQQDWIHSQQARLADVTRLRLALAQIQLLIGKLPEDNNR